MRIKLFESFNNQQKGEEVEYYFITTIADEFGLKELSHDEIEQEYERIMDREDVDDNFCIEKFEDRINIQFHKKTPYPIEGKKEEDLINKFISECEKLNLKVHKHIYQFLSSGWKLRPYLYVRFVVIL